MTRDEARRILLRHRPWIADADDVEFAEALERVRSDSELAEWFARHNEVQLAIRAKMHAVAVPDGLKEQIVSEQRARRAGEGRRNVLVAVAACVVVALVVLLLRPGRSDDFETSFAAYRSRMVGTALRSYDMELETADEALIRAHLATNQCRADYVLPGPLAAVTNTGCGALRWQGHRVSMVCFRSGEPLPPGEKTDLFLFVMDASAVGDAPPVNAPKFEPVNKLMTASWSRGGVIYILAAPGDEKFLKRFL